MDDDKPARGPPSDRILSSNNKAEMKKEHVKNPKKRDILLGKHKEAFNHPGNISFRTLIGANWERYNGARGRSERTAIVVSIVKFLKEDQQVRFLKKDPNSPHLWFVVHDSVAREKVGHAIRDAINFRKSYPNGRGNGGKRSVSSSDTAAASLKDGVKNLQISDESSVSSMLSSELSNSNKRPSPRTIKRKSKRAAKSSAIEALGPPLLEDAPIIPSHTPPILPFVTTVSTDDDSDEAIKMDVAGILGNLKRGTTSQPTTMYSSQQQKQPSVHNNTANTDDTNHSKNSSCHPEKGGGHSANIDQEHPSCSTTPSQEQHRVKTPPPTGSRTIKTPELMSTIAPTHSVDSAESNGDIAMLLPDVDTTKTRRGSASDDAPVKEEKAMLAAFTVWASQNNIPTSKKEGNPFASADP